MRRSVFNFSSAVVLATGCLLATTPAMMAQMRNSGGMGAQTAPQQPGMPQNNMQPNGLMGQQNTAEASFMANMRRNNKVETDLSKMALKNSSNGGVKELAQQVISENRKSDMAMTSAATSNSQLSGISFPAEIPSQTKQAEKQMKKLTGTPFDEMYLSQMNGYVKNDQKTINDASATMNSADMGALMMQMRNTSDERAKQIAQVAQSENFKVE